VEYFLLSQEFRELKVYQSILGLPPSGRTTPSEIATAIELDTRKIYPYLESMIRLGFALKESSIVGSPKRSIYRISDSLLDFWYTFVFPSRSFIELSHPVTPAHMHFFGRRFEVFIRDEVIPLLYPGQDRGRWWHKEEEIDCIVFDSRNSSVYLQGVWRRRGRLMDEGYLVYDLCDIEKLYSDV